MNKDFMKNLPEYTGGTLAEDEFLLKVRGDTGFMTKLNQDGSIPVAFKKWTDDPAVIFKEIPREGWKIVSLFEDDWKVGAAFTEEPLPCLTRLDGITIKILDMNLL